MEEITLRSVYREGLRLFGLVAVRGRRPAIGWIGVMFMASMAGAICFATWRWAAGHPFPDIPGGWASVAIAGIPIVNTLVDQITRHIEVKNEANWRAQPREAGGLVNPHGGAGAA